MSDPQCPGCGRPKEAATDLCCDPCWERLPAKLPVGEGGAMLSWRRRRGTMRVVRDWGGLERINEAIRTWLRENRVTS